MSHFYCSHCGERVDLKARACPHCGADEETGWSSEVYRSSLPSPRDEEEEDYLYYLEKEHWGEKGKKKGWVEWTAIVLVIALALWILGVML